MANKQWVFAVYILMANTWTFLDSFAYLSDAVEYINKYYSGRMWRIETQMIQKEPPNVD